MLMMSLLTFFGHPHEGGYEADYSMYFYDFPTRWAPTVEDALVKAVHNLIARAEK
jgi:hypothetical protein